MNELQQLQVGDKIEQVYGPFTSTWEVVEIIDAGARLAYAGDVKFVGFGHEQQAPNGAWLTSDTDQGFIGRAHWHSAKLVTEAGA